MLIIKAIILLLFIASVAIQVAYWIIAWIYNYREVGSANTAKSYPKVSVIVACYNEAQNIPALLDCLLSQDYPHYEIILVNDHSTDDTLTLLNEGAKTSSLITVLDNNAPKGKKDALTIAIQHAKGEWLAQTDADCRPKPQWLSKMMAAHGGNDMVIGYSPYTKEATFLNTFIRYETWYIAQQYFSMCHLGMPYMGVGRNLLFTKQSFHQVNGYSEHKDIRSGDDDLFINALAPTGRINSQQSPDSFCYSIPKKSWRALIHQKHRHLSTASRYPWHIQLILSALYLSQLGTYWGGFALLFMGQFVGIVWGIWLLRWLLLWRYAYRFTTYYGEKDLWKWVPILDFLLCGYYLLLSFMMFFKPKQW